MALTVKRGKIGVWGPNNGRKRKEPRCRQKGRKGGIKQKGRKGEIRGTRVNNG